MTGTERIRTAIAATTEDYVVARAADVVELFTDAGLSDDPIAVHAAKVLAEGKSLGDTRMMLHRDAHLSAALAKVPA